MDLIDIVGSKMSESLGGIRTCNLGKIEKYDHKKMKAEVQLLVKQSYKDGEEEEVSLLIEVPVALVKAGPFIIRPPYKKGDIVLIGFADTDIENAIMTGEIQGPNSDKAFSVDDAIVIHGINVWNNDLPDEHSKDLVIAKDDFTSKIVMKENGDIDIVAAGNVNIKGALVNIN